MALFAIGDLHLPLGVDKPMDIFGGWDNYVERLRENWEKTVSDTDTVVLTGDISWAMSLSQAEADFRFIHCLKGRKIILKGNHDYWWTTLSKMNGFLSEKGFDSIKILHNNCYAYGSFGICGTRGWINGESEPADAKVLAREKQRLDTSVTMAQNAGLEPLVFLHYPPVYANECNYDLLEVMYARNVKKCWYGHVHGAGHQYAVNGERDGIEFRLVSADYVQFCPVKIM